MNRTSTFATLLIAGALAAQSSVAEVVQSSERTFAVKYKDKTVERYKVSWAAIMDVDVREDGHPAIPKEFKFTDTRQCHWSIKGRVDRAVFMVNRVGQAYGGSTLFRSYNSDFVNKGSDFVLTQLRSENCNDARARRDSDVSNTRNSLLKSFDGIVKGDLEKLKAEVKQNADVVEVTFP